MPLSTPVPRRKIHHRTIDLKAYAREDGLYDIEAHLVDTKPFDFPLVSLPSPLPANTPLHDFWIRLTVDTNYVVKGIEGVSEATPYPLCKEAVSTLSVLVGERIGSGWPARVKEHLRGAASCTHLMELLMTPMATAAIQGIAGLKREGQSTDEALKAPVRLDSCWTHGRHRAVVRQYWPQYFEVESTQSDE